MYEVSLVSSVRVVLRRSHTVAFAATWCANLKQRRSRRVPASPPHRLIKLGHSFRRVTDVPVTFSATNNLSLGVMLHTSTNQLGGTK